jgi:hypothetical protein
MRTPIVVALALFGAACSEQAHEHIPPVKSVTINGARALSLVAGDTLALDVSVLDVFGHTAVARPNFISRNSFVAAVSNVGTVLATGSGTTYVLAYSQLADGTFVDDSVQVNVTQTCSTDPRAALEIAVQDSVTGSTGPFANVAYAAHDGTFGDTAFFASVPANISGHPVLVGLAFERAGSYTVTVKADGYAVWSKSGIIVTSDACHVIPVSVTALLAAP